MAVYLVSTLSDMHGTQELSRTQAGRLLLACFLNTQPLLVLLLHNIYFTA